MPGKAFHPISFGNNFQVLFVWGVYLLVHDLLYCGSMSRWSMVCCIAVVCHAGSNKVNSFCWWRLRVHGAFGVRANNYIEVGERKEKQNLRARSKNPSRPTV